MLLVSSLDSSLVIHQVSAVCSWDSSIHDSVHLNRVTSPNERIYLIIKATVQLSHPASMELVLRKRIAVNIYNKQVNGHQIKISSGLRFGAFFKNVQNLFSFFNAEFHSESQEENVTEEHTVLLWCVLWYCVQHTKGTTPMYEDLCPSVWHMNSFGFIFFCTFWVSSRFCPGLRGAGGEGNVGSHGCSWWQRGDSGWRDIHREIHTGRSGGGEHPQSREATAGIVDSSIKYDFIRALHP